MDFDTTITNLTLTQENTTFVEVIRKISRRNTQRACRLQGLSDKYKTLVVKYNRSSQRNETSKTYRHFRTKGYNRHRQDSLESYQEAQRRPNKTLTTVQDNTR